MKLALASNWHDGMALMPLVQHLVATGNEHLERARSEHNFAVASGRHQENVIASAFNTWRLFRENTSAVHPLVSSPKYAEQANDNEQMCGGVNGLTKSISVPFLPSASFARWAA